MLLIFFFEGNEMGITQIEYVVGLLLFKKILGIYILGMIVIGIPMAWMSRLAWLEPKEWSLLGKILFPDTDIPKDVGEYKKWKTEHPNYKPPAYTMMLQNVHLSDYKIDVPLVRYTLFQMIIWPLRLIYLIWLWGFALFIWTTRKLLF